MDKEAKARIKINKLLEEAGRRFLEKGIRKTKNEVIIFYVRAVGLYKLFLTYLKYEKRI